MWEQSDNITVENSSSARELYTGKTIRSVKSQKSTD